MEVKFIRCRKERGNALLMTLFVGIAMCAMLVYLWEMSGISIRTAGTQEDSAQAATVAEFAANLAIANLTDMQYDSSRTQILKDWVGKNHFDTVNNDQRRLIGTLGDYAYVVKVRSLRDARDNNLSDTNFWLSGLKLADYSFGVDPAERFTGVYEITAAARNIRQGEGNQPWLIPSAVVKTVVGLGSDNNVNVGDPSAPVLTVLTPASIAANEHIAVSGEDHYGIWTAVSISNLVKEIQEVEKIAAQD